jgi:UDPglucose--hexose-1-phosphate uridylyltransferase
MSEIRQNIATKDWVIIATERAKRPKDFLKKRKEEVKLPEYVENCPFCPGNEKMAPVENFSIRDGKNWKVRVIPNKFPAVSAVGKLINREKGIIRWVSGVGIHDVIIETPKHNLTTALLDNEQVLDIIKTYKERYLDVMKDDRVELIMFFKNHGESAGTSLEHPHSQMVATPVVPSYIRQRIADTMHYYDDHRECIFCKMLREEIKMGERIILESKNFVGFIPYAALSPFHIWILPKRHMASFPEINDEEMVDFADVLKTILKKIYYGLNNPDYNYVIRSLPGISRKNRFFHWYFSIIPRVSKAAGFELGSGMFINVALPEESARFLRGVKG